MSASFVLWCALSHAVCLPSQRVLRFMSALFSPLSVCDDCSQLKSEEKESTAKDPKKPLAASTSVHALPCDGVCVLGNYFEWLTDSDFTYPPHCSLCNRVVRNDGTAIRLVCKELFHQSCLREYCAKAIASQTNPAAAAKEIRCPHCQTLMIDTSTQLRTRLRDRVQNFIASVVNPKFDGSSVSSSSDSFAAPSANTAVNSNAASNTSVSDRDRDRYNPQVAALIQKARQAQSQGATSIVESATHTNGTTAASSHAINVLPSSAASSSSSSSSLPHHMNAEEEDVESRRPTTSGSLAEDDKHSKARLHSVKRLAAGSSKSIAACLQPKRIVILLMLLTFLIGIFIYFQYGLQFLTSRQ